MADVGTATLPLSGNAFGYVDGPLPEKIIAQMMESGYEFASFEGLRTPKGFQERHSVHKKKIEHVAVANITESLANVGVDIATDESGVPIHAMVTLGNRALQQQAWGTNKQDRSILLWCFARYSDADADSTPLGVGSARVELQPLEKVKGSFLADDQGTPYVWLKRARCGGLKPRKLGRYGGTVNMHGLPAAEHQANILKEMVGETLTLSTMATYERRNTCDAVKEQVADCLANQFITVEPVRINAANSQLVYNQLLTLTHNGLNQVQLKEISTTVYMFIVWIPERAMSILECEEAVSDVLKNQLVAIPDTPTFQDIKIPVMVDMKDGEGSDGDDEADHYAQPGVLCKGKEHFMYDDTRQGTPWLQNLAAGLMALQIAEILLNPHAEGAVADPIALIAHANSSVRVMETAGDSTVFQCDKLTEGEDEFIGEVRKALKIVGHAQIKITKFKYIISVRSRTPMDVMYQIRSQLEKNEAISDRAMHAFQFRPAPTGSSDLQQGLMRHGTRKYMEEQGIIKAFHRSMPEAIRKEASSIGVDISPLSDTVSGIQHHLCKRLSKAGFGTADSINEAFESARGKNSLAKLTKQKPSLVTPPKQLSAEARKIIGLLTLTPEAGQDRTNVPLHVVRELAGQLQHAAGAGANSGTTRVPKAHTPPSPRDARAYEKWLNDPPAKSRVKDSWDSDEGSLSLDGDALDTSHGDTTVLKPLAQAFPTATSRQRRSRPSGTPSPPRAAAGGLPSAARAPAAGAANTVLTSASSTARRQGTDSPDGSWQTVSRRRSTPDKRQRDGSNSPPGK